MEHWSYVQTPVRELISDFIFWCSRTSWRCVLDETEKVFFLASAYDQLALFSLGDPMEVLERLLIILYAKFGGFVNEKGFKVLDKHVRIIQGDGVNMQSIKDIVNLTERLGFAADNLIFGSGG